MHGSQVSSYLYGMSLGLIITFLGTIEGKQRVRAISAHLGWSLQPENNLWMMKGVAGRSTGCLMGMIVR